MKTPLEKFAEWMTDQKIDVVILEDREETRNSNIRYLTGHPGDALLFIFQSGDTLLLPWDMHMAAKMASATEIIPYNDFGRSGIQAIQEILKTRKIGKGNVIELSSSVSHTGFKKLQSAIPNTGLLCREDGAEEQLGKMRMIKTDKELEIYGKAFAITDKLIDELEEGLRKNSFPAELDAALFIEKRSRELGAEGSSFEIIAAGPERSFGIHAVPAFSAAGFLGSGLSLIDFGVRYCGYCTDVTVGITREPLSEKQHLMASLTARAHKSCMSACRPGTGTKELNDLAAAIFSDQGFTLDHALGHGIGLDVHEAPYLRGRDSIPLEAGMIITIEPGLYDKHEGGIRLENDVLITEDGHKTLTNSRMIHL